jgi:histone H3
VTESKTIHLRTLSTDTTGELNVLGHDGNTLGVDGAQVGVLEKSNKVGLSSLLKGKNGRSLETKIGLEVLGNLTHKTLEGQLADEKVGRLLVTTDLTKSYGSGTVTVGLLNSSGGGGRLTSGLGGELLARSLSSSGFTCGLLGTGHFE